MAAIPPLSEDDVFDFVGAASISKGRPYVAHSLSGLRQQGSVLRGWCQGTADAPYRVEVRFSDGELGDALCSCPVGGGGGCKHVAALLLAWCAEPQRFLEAEVLEASLKRRTKDDLIALIRRLLDQQPELEWLLETPIPGAKGGSRNTDPHVYHRQAEVVFRNAGDDWRASYGVATQLGVIREIGDDFLEREEYGPASAVYRGILAAGLEHYYDVHDEESEIARVLSECVEGLAACLENAADAVDRLARLRALFDAYAFDIGAGGFGIADEAPAVLIDASTPDERRTVAGWVRKLLEELGGKETADFSRRWSRSAVGGFLLDLEAEELDDESYLAVCRDSGRLADAVERLLELGRLDEAVAEARRAGDYDLLALGDLFVAQGHPGVAVELVRARSRSSQDTRLLEWLKRRAADTGDWAGAAVLARQLFDERPSLPSYEELRKLHRELGSWEAAREELISNLNRQDNRSLLVQIYLDEREIDAALKLLARPRAVAWQGIIGAQLRLEVARTAEAKRPEAAREIYQNLAEELIRARGRDNYIQACGLLRKVRDLFIRTGDDAGWERYVARIRAENTSLRALKEELQRAGL